MMKYFKLQCKETGKFCRRFRGFTASFENASYLTEEQARHIQGLGGDTTILPVEVTGSRFYFQARFSFDHIDRQGPRQVHKDFATLEALLAAYSTERRRRKVSDRCTGGTYLLKLTEAGLAEWLADSQEDPHGFRARCRGDIDRDIRI
jgi:hypothetical protein